jgi:hypothetical protein
MATYVNDLRLKEIATGDESGTWGTSTNTNLELIAEAMGVGAEAVANASTHTITMADGATDQFRSTFLRLTGGGQACTVTLAPNTLSHTWIMRNETAAALTLTQGSGANVAIAAGQTKIVATDGAGSGAIVYEMDDLELAGNLLVGGTLGVTGVLTANAGVVVDNITIDGTTIALSSGDLTLDVAGDIILDADGADVIFKDGGTSFLEIDKDGNNARIKNPISDGDVLLQGNDGGSIITALTLDMSDAGAATFNSTGTFAGGNANFTNDADVVTLNGSLHTRLLIDTSSTGGHQAALVLESNGTQSIIGNTGSGTSISVATGDLTLDVAGDINLDADGADINLKDGGTAMGRIGFENGDLNIASSQQDYDIHLKGNDGGSVISALHLDMSDAGAATFNSGIAINGRNASTPGLAEKGDLNTGIFWPAADTIAVTTAGTERIRVNSAGLLLHGTTAQISACFQGTVFNGTNFNGHVLQTTRSAVGSNFLGFLNSSGTVAGAILHNGSTTVSYGASSDQRLKENILDSDDSGSTIDAIKIRKFDWIDGSAHEKYGFIAQELKTVVPNSICSMGLPDEEDPMLGVDPSKLMALAIKEIQMLRARVAQLENN